MSHRTPRIAVLACATLAVTAGTGLAATIADAKTHAMGETVTIDSAVITSTTDLVNSSSSDSMYIQDETGGLTLYGSPTAIGAILAIAGEGDAISITGKVVIYNGLFELGTPFTDVVKLGHPGIPAPTEVTVADFQDNSPTAEALESKLVKLGNVLFTQIGNFAYNVNYKVKDADNPAPTPAATTRVSTTLLNLVGEPIPTVAVDLVGIFSQYNSSNPAAGYQLLLRSKSDVIPVNGNFPPNVLATPPLAINKGAGPVTLTIQATDPDNGPFPLKYSVKSGAAGTGPSLSLPFCGTLTDPASTPAGNDVTAGGPLVGNQVVFTPNPDASGWFVFTLAADDGAGTGEAKVNVFIQDTTRAVITEIMYAPANNNPDEVNFDSDWEWVEITNRTDADIYLGSLLDGALTTQDNLYYLTLPANATLVLAKPDRAVWTRAMFLTEWSPLADTTVLQMFGYGLEGEPRLGNGGDLLRLFDADGRLLDVVAFTNGDGWPIANYQSSIYLRHDAIDTAANDSGTNWQLSVSGACDAWTTPGGDIGSPGVIPSSDCSFPPTADNLEAFVTQDSSVGVAITLVGSDPDGSEVTFLIVTDPTSGTMIDPDNNDASVGAGSTLAATHVRYFPAAGVSGDVTFTYKVNDGSNDSPTATVTVHIIPPAPDKVIITEIMYNPSNLDANWEWVEVHNLTDNPVDLKTLNDAKNENDGNLAGMTLLAHETRIILKEEIAGFNPRTLAEFLAEWSPLTADQVLAISGTSILPALNNTGGDTLTLIGADNAVLDTVVYEVDSANGWPSSDGRASIYLKAGSLTTTGNDLGTHWALSVDGTDGAYRSATSETDITYDLGSPGILPGSIPVTPPVVLSMASRKGHGTAGTFDILNTDAKPIECRKGGPTQLVVTFDKAIEQVTGTNADVSLSSGTVDSLLIDGPTLTINLTGAADSAVLAVGFAGIAASGTPTAQVTDTARICVQIGDVNQDGRVNVLDMTRVRNNTGATLVTTNFTADLNVDGRVNTLDMTTVRLNLGKAPLNCP
ncbi:MAG TPA: lamin tail domain-containing protein [Phycisphaerae bacterium]|nr:lamin tail domain-containing protein [Phycisphaerae bacterium]HRY68945.1 lamin tail domain-containing protein [Phycisphaerae bacterium]HSA25772.1 lamin tail domain-containing protein [Phycisphaerae bacterium]